MLVIVIGVLLVPFFIFTLGSNVKFLMSTYSKSEEGQWVLGKASKYVLPIFPLGWLIIELYHRFISNISYETYRDGMMVLILLLFTVQGFIIRHHKKITEVESTELA
ncbi:hypothetical protein PGH26_08505 [Sporosarcina jeotgali]|uniref:DUF1648 domain-containing protein n=1 Tax=Sporosarcina jeotgali TaxID=3020056 RepID=A0ABZ0KVU6_9BACL|nr:hypothetical protein [Sporosarcina sp. B2O-1]WOV82984.1 hypothetical protein PGH26_08505 [Sporosarcina sp. B2O-1]